MSARIGSSGDESPSFVCVARCFRSSCSRCSLVIRYMRERGVSNKQEERDERMGEKKDPLCTLKIRNRQKVYKRDPGKKKKKRARLCVHLTTRTPRAAQT
jgi:hypothetical protein